MNRRTDEDSIDWVLRYIFAGEDEIAEKHFSKPKVKRLMRLRSGYAYWQRWPKLNSAQVADHLMEQFGISHFQANDDVRMLRVCLGNFNSCSKEYDRYVFRVRAEEAFEMARKNNDAKAFAAALATFGKYAQLDKQEADKLAYDLIVPATFEPTENPEAAGFKRIPRAHIKELEAKYLKQTEIQEAVFEEVPAN